MLWLCSGCAAAAQRPIEPLTPNTPQGGRAGEQAACQGRHVLRSELGLQASQHGFS